MPLIASTKESCSWKKKREKEKKKKRKQRRRSPSYSSESDRESTQQAEKSACQRGLKEARPTSTSQSQAGTITEAETGCLSLDEPQESVARETVSPERDSVPMEFELGGGSNSPTHSVTTRGHMFADVVAGRDTSVFRPTPAEAVALPGKHSAGTGQ